MRRGLLYIAVWVLALAGSVSAGEDRGRPSGPPPGGERPGGPGMQFGFDPRTWGNIELTPSQKSRLLDVMTDNFRASQEAILEQMEARRGREEPRRGGRPREGGKPPEGNARLSTLQRQLRQEIEAILTPEQLKQLGDGRGAPPPRGGQEDRRPPTKRK